MSKPIIYPIRLLISTDALHEAAMKEMAKSRGISVSELVRNLIDDEINRAALMDLIAAHQPQPERI